MVEGKEWKPHRTDTPRTKHKSVIINALLVYNIMNGVQHNE